MESPDLFIKSYKFYFIKEYEIIKSELKELKNCQITFIKFSVTTTALIFGLVAGCTSILPNPRLFQSFLFLSPLIIIIPAWWVFFDKATTISRAVGYCRVLEDLILEKCNASMFLGFENGLQKLRDEQGSYSERLKSILFSLFKRDTISKILRMFVFFSPFRYWMITYYIFLGLSVLCIIMSMATSFSNEQMSSNLWVLYSTIWIIVGVSAIWNLKLIYQLVYGKYSYKANEKKWKKTCQIVYF